MDARDVIVVGGGIGGLGAAFALSRQGLAVRALERSHRFGEVGAGIQLAPNCTRILDACGLLDEATRLGVVPDTMVMRDATDGAELTRLDLRDVERRYGSPYLVIHRSDLHGLLLRASPAHPRGREVDLGEVAVYVGPACHLAHYGERVCRTCGATSGGGCTTANRSPPGWRDGSRCSATRPTRRCSTSPRAAIMAIEDGWVLGAHAARSRSLTGAVDWDATLVAYQAVRPQHSTAV